MKSEPDHVPQDPAPFPAREWEDGGWADFERWCGISYFGGKEPSKERYGTIRSDTQVPSRFPIVEETSRNGTEPSPKPKSRFPKV